MQPQDRPRQLSPTPNASGCPSTLVGPPYDEGNCPISRQDACVLDELSSVHLPAVVRDRVIQRLLIHAVRARSWLLGGVYTAGALVVMVDNEGHLLLVKPTYRRGWGFPGGGMKRKEQADAAAEREVWEEVGIEVTVGAPSFVYVQRERRHID